MRGIACLALSGLLGAPAGAGCFAADGMPERAVYEGGTVLEYLGHEGDVLTYRSGQTTTRMKDGIWPLDHRGEGFRMDYRWDAPLPDLKAVIAAGGKARVEGSRVRGTEAPVPVVSEVEILGTETVEWEDCRYNVVRFRKTLFVGDRKESEGVMLYAPDAMIAFRTEVVELATGEVYSYALEALE